MAKVELRGVPEAVHILKELPARFQKRALIRVMRRAVRPMVSAARANVPQSKTIKSSIQAFEPKSNSRKENPVLFVGPRFSRDRNKDPWFAHFIEGGSQGVGRFGGKYGARSRAAADKKNDIFRFINAKRKTTVRYRKDQTRRPFMRPAIDSTHTQVRTILIDELLQHLKIETDKLKR